MEKLKLWLADIRQFEEREEACLALLTPERRARAERYKQRDDRLSCIAAGLLLRKVLSLRSDDQVTVDPHGKPALTAGSSQFNLTHGGHYAALAVFHTAVGVDVEPEQGRKPILPRRFLLPDEAAWLERELTPERFAWLWTRLEAALKADGQGLAMKGRDFSVLESGQPWHLHTFAHDGHMISCAAGEEFQVELRELTLEELME